MIFNSRLVSPLSRLSPLAPPSLLAPVKITVASTVLFTVAFTIAVTTLLAGCGPSQTSSDRDNDQIRADFAHQQNILAPLVGTYVGTLTNRQNSNKTFVSMILAPATVQSTTGGRGQTSSVATLSGSYIRCLNGAPTETSTCPGRDIGATFTNADYNTASDPAILSLSGPLSGPDGTANSNGTAGSTAFFALNVSGNHLSGTYSTNGGTVGQLELDKVQ